MNTKHGLRDYFIAGLKAKMAKDGLNQESLCAGTKLAKGTISNILSKKNYGKISSWEKIAKAAGFEDLFACIEKGRAILEGEDADVKTADPFKDFSNPDVAKKCQEV